MGTLGFIPNENLVGSVEALPTQDAFSLGAIAVQTVLARRIRRANIFTHPVSAERQDDRELISWKVLLW